MPLSPRARATRQSILDAAVACFAARGLRATSLRQIAARAGVTQPLIHHYFGSKDDLLEAVIEQVTAEYDLAQTEQWDLPAGDLRFVTDALVILFRWIGDHTAHMRPAAWARLEGWTPPSASMSAIWTRVRQRVQDLAEAGALRPGLDPDLALVQIECLFKGYWDRREVLPHYPIDAEHLDERILRSMLETLWHGLLTPEAAREARALYAATWRSTPG